MVGTSAARVLRMIATDRMQAARIATGGKDAHVVPRVYGRVAALLGHFALRAPSRRVWRVDFGVMHLILSSTRTTGATLIFTFRYPTSMYTLILGVVVP